MTASRHTPWVRHFDAIGDELLRLSVACDVRLRDPGVVDRILQNDATVCGTKNPIGFRKLHNLLKATFDSINKSVDRIGADETRQIIDALAEHLDHIRTIGGSGPKQFTPGGDS